MECSISDHCGSAASRSGSAPCPLVAAAVAARVGKAVAGVGKGQNWVWMGKYGGRASVRGGRSGG